MALFKVKDIIDGKTIQVSGWKSGDSYKGSFVRIEGYDVPTNFEEYTRNKLRSILENKSVELKNVSNFIKGEGEGNDTVVCRVFLDEIDISTYFIEFKSLAKS